MYKSDSERLMLKFYVFQQAIRGCDTLYLLRFHCSLSALATAV